MQILRANLEQIDAVTSLFDLYRQFYEEEANLEGCKDYIRERMSNDESVIFLARSMEGVDLGFTQLYRSYCSVEMTKLVYLYDLFVVPKARRKGVARALMDTARDYAAAYGAGRLQLETAKTNLAGQALYECLGWEKDTEFYTYHLPLDQ